MDFSPCIVTQDFILPSRFVGQMHKPACELCWNANLGDIIVVFTEEIYAFNYVLNIKFIDL